MDMQRKLQICFGRGINALPAAQEIGLDKKTAYRYYDEWTEQIIESETGDFLERQKKEHQRIILSFDNDILEAYKFFDEIDIEIHGLQKENKLVPKHLFSIKLDLMRYISDLKEKKGAISMQPTMEYSMDKKIKEMFAEYVKDTKND